MITNESILSSQQIAGRVVRWHTWPMIRKPTVNEHQARVTQLYIAVWGLPRAEVLQYCVNHDMGELEAGDTPFGAKRRVPELAAALNKAEKGGLERLKIVMPELSDQEFRRFKVCDLLEMWETAVVEFNMGNRYAEPSILSCRQTVYELTREFPEDRKMLEEYIFNSASATLREDLRHV